MGKNKKKNKPVDTDFAAAVGTAGTSVSQAEAQQIANDTGRSAAEVLAFALQRGSSLEADAVNAYNKGKLGPNGVTRFGKVAIGRGGKAATAAMDYLSPMAGLRMQAGTEYFGSTSTSTPGRNTRALGGGVNFTPGSTTYNPIILPSNRVVHIEAAANAAAGGGQTTPWEQSVNDSNQALIDSINQQIAANTQQAQLYMGQIDSLMKQMQGTNLNSIVPYATTTTAVDPATGAKTTSAIAPRKKPTETDLSISPLLASTVGTGLNIGI